MTDIQIREFRGHEVRIVVDSDGQPQWVASDVAKVLDYSEAAAMTRHLDQEERGRSIVQTLGGSQSVLTITESGLYSAILRSRKPEAKEFKRWVTAEVLPSIRRTGRYAVQEQPLSGRELMARAVLEAQKVITEQETRIKELEPKASAWVNLASIGGDLSVGEAAKVLSRDPDILLGRQRLFAYLKEIGWIYRTGVRREHWQAYQRQVDMGRLTQKIGKPFWNSRTEEWEQSAPQIRITPKGLEALRDRLSVGNQLAII